MSTAFEASCGYDVKEFKKRSELWNYESDEAYVPVINGDMNTFISDYCSLKHYQKTH